MTNSVKIFLVAVLSFLFGWMLFKSNSPRSDGSATGLNKTKVVKDGEDYFIVFCGVVILSRRITKEQYDTFIAQYPNAQADGNAIDKFSTPPPKYTREGDIYYEYVWAGNEYGKKVEITKEEFLFRSKNNQSQIVVPETL